MTDESLAVMRTTARQLHDMSWPPAVVLPSRRHIADVKLLARRHTTRRFAPRPVLAEDVNEIVGAVRATTLDGKAADDILTIDVRRSGSGVSASRIVPDLDPSGEPSLLVLLGFPLDEADVVSYATAALLAGFAAYEGWLVAMSRAYVGGVFAGVRSDVLRTLSDREPRIRHLIALAVGVVESVAR